jgi:hypothetical protein
MPGFMKRSRRNGRAQHLAFGPDWDLAHPFAHKQLSRKDGAALRAVEKAADLWKTWPRNDSVSPREKTYSSS